MIFPIMGLVFSQCAWT